MKLNRNHPFVIKAFEAEQAEQEAGAVTDEVLEIRKWLKANYPDLYAVYIDAKEARQKERKLKAASKKDEAKRARRIRGASILKSRMEARNFGRDIR